MKALIDLITALSPLIVALTPVLLVVVGWWVNKQTKKTTDKQTENMKEDTRLKSESVKSAITDATGTFRAPPSP